MIEFQHVTKTYSGKLALDDLNLTIHDGEIFGLIGHNGAGKSTAIKTLVSVIEPTSGKLFIDGKLLATHRNEIKKQIGYVADSPDIFLKLTAIELWHFIGRIYDVPTDVCERRIEQLCQLFELGDAQHQVVESFSHGMRQKTFIIAALISEPNIWVLDEPLTGLDPQSAFNLKNMMRQHAKDGHVVLFSTHVLAVAEELCDRIGILRHGKLLFCGTMDELRQAHLGINLEDIYLRLIQED